MEDNSKEHIGTAELAKLLEESRERPESAMDASRAHPHLAACASCREQYEGLALLDRQLKGVKPIESEPNRDCPGPALWREVAGGLTPPEETLARIEHASRCGHCGPLLQQAVAELAALNGEMTEAERKHISALESAREGWQRGLAQRIVGTNPLRRGREPASWWQRQLVTPRLALVATFLLAAIGVGSWLVIQRNQPAAASRLLARAYTEKRTLEPRIAGAGYAPLRISRGPSASFTSRPAPLLKAEALIATQLESHPSDPLWLQAQAQADLLEGKYDAAVEVLRHALQLDPRSPALLTDLATAYFQRALEEDHNEDFGIAFENLSQALNQRPDDPVALFNRAIVSEHQFLYRQALDDWDHYLRLDSGSQWAEEARNRANAVREKLKQLGRELTPLLSPAQLIALVSSATFASELEARIEEYLHEAIRSWLPQAFPEGHGADPSAGQALFFLADLTSRQHGDRWLADLLRRSSAPHFPQAANALARAVRANDAGNDDVSRQQADIAKQLFRASGNAAGVLRARFELSYSAQFDRRSDECRREAASALAESEKHLYPWVQVQLGLEKSVCANLMSDIGTSQSAAQQAMDKARENNYGALYIRALGFVADDGFAMGDQAGGLRLVNAGLERYWSAPYPLMRGYSLYTELADSAATAGQPVLRVAVWREALALIDSDENLLLRAAANRATADAATAAHQPRIAQQRYAEAARLFALAPRTEANHINVLENEIRTAQMEARQLRFDDALARLTRIQDQIHLLSNNYLAQIFYSTLGELQLGRHREAEAEQALRPALALAEQSLATLGSEAERTSWSKDAAPAYLALVEAELAQGRSQEALETYEWYLGAPQRVSAIPKVHPSAFQPIPNPPPPEPSAVASHLALLAEETVLAYALLPDGLAIWVYDDRGMKSCWIPKSTDALQELAERFNDLASDPGSESHALRRDARSLYDLLIGPVERYLTPGRTLVFETEGWLANLPFEALLDTHDQYLIERAPVLHSLGRDSQARLHRDTGISADSISLVVGSTVSSSAHELIPLPNVTAEADAVGRHFHSARVLKGRDASLVAVNNALPAAAVFHFAGHSLATSDRAGLLLEPASGKAEPQLLDADQLRRMPLPSLQLAVLSACNTGERSGSHEFNSVTETLVRAGVPHVVASRWAVDSVVSGVFVEDFYSNLLSGERVSEAIQITSRKMLSHPQTSHPYYWSAFAAYGKR